MRTCRIIILHGWGQDKTSWRAFVERFPHLTVETLNLPGFGEEPLISDTWGVPEYAAWVRRKIEESISDKEQIVLLGHSFGGRIAALIGSENPSWLRGLVLYGAPVLYRPNTSVRIRIRVARFLKSFFPRGLYQGNKELI